MMKFSTIDHGFCESTGHKLPYPEILNSYSSIFISIIGLIGLLLTLKYKRIYEIRFIYGMLMVNGYGSFCYHYTQQIGYAMVDELSMMLGVILGLHTLYNIIINSMHLPVSQNDFICKFIHNHIFYKATCTTILSFYFILSYSISIFEETRYLFPFLFAIPAVLLIPGCIYVYSTYYYDKHDGAKLLELGLLCSLFATFVWMTTEPFCERYPIIKYLHTHVFWHIFMSYGLFLIIQFLLHFHLYVTDGIYYEITMHYGIPFFNHNV